MVCMVTVQMTCWSLPVNTVRLTRQSPRVLWQHTDQLQLSSLSTAVYFGNPHMRIFV